MFLLYGQRSLIIKKYTDHTHACPHCRGLNLDVKIEKSYYHLFYIPFFPSGGKFAHIQCGDCGKPYKDPVLEEDYYIELEDEYEKRTKNPLYLYTGLILIALLTLFMLFSNLRTQQQKAEYIAQPQTGDTYLIRERRDDQKFYYFLHVTRINGDSIFTQRSHQEYRRFRSKMNEADYFEPGKELLYTKAMLKKMLEEHQITSVKREKQNK